MKFFRWAIFGSCLVWVASTARNSPPASPAGNPPQVTLYDPDPGHLWNRLHAAILLRVDADGKRFGSDELDILHWTETSHLRARTQLPARLPARSCVESPPMSDRPVKRHCHPTRRVPAGPVRDFTRPHGREGLG